MIERESLRLQLQKATTLLPDDAYGLAPGEKSGATYVWRPSPVPAAVLLGLVGYVDGPRVILTLRTEELRNHAGQISLPGGRIEPGDRGPEAAALREAHEEIGLSPEEVDVLGVLPPYNTPTGFQVHPVVGWIAPPVSLVPDPVEVAEVFEVPLAFILDSGNHLRGFIEAEGRTRRFHVLDYNERHIWGATAGILVGFARLVGG